MSAPATPLPLPASRAPIAPLPPAMWTRTRGALSSPIFRRWIVLSILLHVLAILLFGSPEGGQREGRAMFGRLSVVIREGWRDTGPDLKMERALAPKPADAAVPPMLERLPTPEPTMQLAPTPQAPPPLEAPPAPVAPLVAPATLEPIAAPKVERRLVDLPPEPAPIVAPMPPEPEPIAAPVPPALLEPLPAARLETPLVEAPPAPPIEPAMIEPLPAPRLEQRLAEPPPMPSVPTPAAAPPAAPASTPAPSPEARPGVTPPQPAPAESLFRRPPAQASPDYDPTAAPPSLDMDAIRKRAGELGRVGTGNRAALPFPMPPVPAKKSTLESAIEKARKPDCRDAYKHLGLAAVVPLIANEFGEGKCRW